MENNNQDDLYQKEKKESLNMNLNTSELPTQKNSTLKKIQFYVQFFSYMYKKYT